MKIFKKSDKSRNKLDLNFELSHWWLRSARTYVLTGFLIGGLHSTRTYRFTGFFVGGINWNGCVRIFYTHGYDVVKLAPVCMI